LQPGHDSANDKNKEEVVVGMVVDNNKEEEEENKSNKEDIRMDDTIANSAIQVQQEKIQNCPWKRWESNGRK